MTKKEGIHIQWSSKDLNNGVQVSQPQITFLLFLKNSEISHIQPSVKWEKLKSQKLLKDRDFS